MKMILGRGTEREPKRLLFAEFALKILLGQTSRRPDGQMSRRPGGHMSENVMPKVDRILCLIACDMHPSLAADSMIPGYDMLVDLHVCSIPGFPNVFNRSTWVCMMFMLSWLSAVQQYTG
mmetsp:Transcript_129992/g.224727  ORF Transcript_129992/g.224727 Transcript_129992/m.224727 type:complete len:120 (-) Transcript_129992:3-362(-)